MGFLQDIMAAIGVVINGLPQGLLALSYGFASVPTAIGFIIGAVSGFALHSVTPISFQAETIVLAGSMGKDRTERLSMIFFAGIIMAVLGLAGVLNSIVAFAGDVVIHAMMVGVGFILARISIDMVRQNTLVGSVSMAVALIVYLFFGRNLVYTVISSLVISSIVSNLAKQDRGDTIVEEFDRFKLCKPTINLSIIRGALALMCLIIGGNIAFGGITGGIAGATQNIDHLTIYSGLADAASSLFGGGPVEAIISATGSAPHPVLAAVLMMVIMAAILFVGLLPKVGKYVPSQSIAGFLFVLGALVTVPGDAVAAFSGTTPGSPIVAGVTMVVTATTDPFIGMVSGIILQLLFGVIGI